MKKLSPEIHYFPHKSFHDIHITARLPYYIHIVSDASGRLFHIMCPFVHGTSSVKPAK